MKTKIVVLIFILVVILLLSTLLVGQQNLRFDKVSDFNNLPKWNRTVPVYYGKLINVTQSGGSLTFWFEGDDGTIYGVDMDLKNGIEDLERQTYIIERSED